MISTLLTLIIIGVILWLVFTYIPMAEPIRTIVRVVVVIVVILWLLSLIGVVPMPLRL